MGVALAHPRMKRISVRGRHLHNGGPSRARASDDGAPVRPGADAAHDRCGEVASLCGDVATSGGSARGGTDGTPGPETDARGTRPTPRTHADPSTHRPIAATARGENAGEGAQVRPTPQGTRIAAIRSEAPLPTPRPTRGRWATRGTRAPTRPLEYIGRRRQKAQQPRSTGPRLREAKQDRGSSPTSTRYARIRHWSRQRDMPRRSGPQPKTTFCWSGSAPGKAPSRITCSLSCRSKARRFRPIPAPSGRTAADPRRTSRSTRTFAKRCKRRGPRGEDHAFARRGIGLERILSWWTAQGSAEPGARVSMMRSRIDSMVRAFAGANARSPPTGSTSTSSSAARTRPGSDKYIATRDLINAVPEDLLVAFVPQVGNGTCAAPVVGDPLSPTVALGGQCTQPMNGDDTPWSLARLDKDCVRSDGAPRLDYFESSITTPAPRSVAGWGRCDGDGSRHRTASTRTSPMAGPHRAISPIPAIPGMPTSGIPVRGQLSPEPARGRLVLGKPGCRGRGEQLSRSRAR